MRHFLHVLMTLSLLLACSRTADAPQEPVWGKQPCGHCAMLLSEQDNGAQAVTVQDERLYFDDIGCLIAWQDANPGAARASWVHTADTHAWVPAEQAHYDVATHTPMDFGFAATSQAGHAAWSAVRESVLKKLHSH